ncbi:MAG TPA: carboxyl transferase domain-containing protein, partial [Candidatus Kapabacteria bacterium]|nr:carboxyl transferase domain-containing protein [Candidatus Kapabacteria bacterium]
MAKTIGKPIERTLAFEKNVDGNKELLRIINERAAKTKQGGGTKAQEKLKEKNKMPVRERITALIDEGSNFLEIGLFVADGMYVQEGGAPSAGVVTGIGLIHGRECLIVANDPTVKAGAWFPMTAKKNMRIQEIAIENKVPIIYLVDSAGVFLP